MFIKTVKINVQGWYASFRLDCPTCMLPTVEKGVEVPAAADARLPVFNIGSEDSVHSERQQCIEIETTIVP